MDLDSNLFGLGLDSDSNLFGLGLDSDSNLFGLGLVLDSTKVDLTTALDLKNRIVALHKNGVSYKKIAKTLKLSCRMVTKTIQRFNRTGSTQNRPRQCQPKKLRAHAQHHIQRLCSGNRCMSAASIAAEVEWVGDKPVSAQTIRGTLH